MKKIVSIALVLMLMLSSLAVVAESIEEGMTIDDSYTKEQAVEDTKIATADLSDQLEDQGEAAEVWVDESVSGEISYLTWDNAAPYYAEAFIKHYPNVKVTVNVIGDYWTKLNQSIVTGTNVPDVSMISSSEYVQVANSAMFEDLSKYGADDAMRENYITSWWDSGIGEDGVFRVAPNSPGMSGCFYRRDVAMELLGTDDPAAVHEAASDWDKVYELGIKLRDMTDGKKFIIPDVEHLEELLRQQSGKTYVMDNKLDLSFLRPVWETCLKFREAGLDSKYWYGSPEGNEMMKNGDVFFYNSGSWFESYGIVSICGTETDGLWGVTDMTDGNISFGGNGFAIPAAAENKDLAWLFIKFCLTDLELQADQLKRFSCYPALVAATDDPYFDLPVPLFNGQKARKAYGEIGKNIVLPARSEYDTGINAITMKYFADMILGNTDIDTALALAEDEVRSVYMELD